MTATSVPDLAFAPVESRTLKGDRDYQQDAQYWTRALDPDTGLSVIVAAVADGCGSGAGSGRIAKTAVRLDAYKQYAVFDGDVECYAYTYVRDRVTGRLRQVAHDDERGWYTGVQIEHVRRDPDIERRCEQCGRTGTRGFRTLPDADIITDGHVAVAAHSITECANRAACRRRWPKPQEVDE